MRWTISVAVLAVGMTAPISGQDSPRAREADQDQKFVREATAAGMAEVNLSRRALTGATRQEVKDFARHMVEDHTKANTELLAVVNKKGFARAASNTMPAEHRALDARLGTLRGEDFDRTYMKQMVKDHEDAVQLFQTQAKSGKDDDLKAFAEKTLPTLKKHLEMARKVAGEKDTDRDKK